jgi:acyl-CoA reductase-like NAD-dependent aldehyde dehydrogenase
MTTALEPELSTYRWSSHDEADRFPVEDPATGEVITLVRGGGTAEVNAAVEAAHRAFQAGWRWRAQPSAPRSCMAWRGKQ